MPADPLLIEGLVPPWAVRSASVGAGRHYSFALSAFGSPHADLSARVLTSSGGSVSFVAIEPPLFDTETADFRAYGFGRYHDHEGEPDLSTYRTYTGTGIFRKITDGSHEITEITMGAATATGYSHSEVAGWDAADLPGPDAISVWNAWVTPWELIGTYSDRGDQVYGFYWTYPTSTQARAVVTYHYPYGMFPEADAAAEADATAAVELSDACQWSDLATFACSAATKLGETLLHRDTAFALSTGAGQSDGTEYMRRLVARYRIEAAAFDRTVRWKVVKRRLVPRLWRGGGVVTPTTTLLRTENLELIARPYYDEFGAWSPTELLWDEVPEKALAWRGNETGAEVVTAQTSANGPGGIVNGYAVAPRVWASRIRAQVVAGAVHTVRWRVLRTPPGLPTGETFVDSPVTDGFTEPLEFGPEVGVSSTTVRVHELLDASEVVVGATARTLYKSRRLWRTVGWPPFQVGSDPIPAHTYYRRRTWTERRELNATAEWTGFAWLWHTPCVYLTELSFYRDYDLTSGAKLDRVITVATGTANGIEFPPPPWGNVEPDGNYSIRGAIISGVLAETTATAPVVEQLTVPVDHTEAGAVDNLMASGVIDAPEEVVEMEERVPAGRAGRWHYLEAPRGYSLHVEEAAWDTPFVGARVGFGKVGAVRVI